jgi:hypothetical protein
MRRLSSSLGALGLAAVSIALVPGVARADGCMVRGQHVVLSDLIVRPSRVAPLTVTLYGVPASARLGARRGASIAISVKAAIAFQGARKNVWYRVARPLTVADGMIALEGGAQLVDAVSHGNDVVASVVMRAEDVVEGEDKQADETVRFVRIPCGALTLDAPEQGEDETADEPEAAGGDEGRWWIQRKAARSTTLRAQPRAEATRAVLTTTLDDYHFAFERVAEQGRWMRVRRLGSGVRVTGWIRRGELEPSNEPEGVAGGCSGDHGPGLSGRGWGGKPPVTVYKGPAHLRVGAQLHDGGDPWATVRQSEGFEVEVFDWNGRTLVEVTGIPGVGVDSWRARVAPEDVSRDR